MFSFVYKFELGVYDKCMFIIYWLVISSLGFCVYGLGRRVSVLIGFVLY